MEIAAVVRAAAAIAVAAGSTHTFREPLAAGAGSCEAFIGSIAAQVSGAYEHIAGSMRTVGLAELGSRTLKLSYTGTLCGETSQAEGGR
ncbi:MAG TPA: hypothetical protein VK928_00480 [Longimicrobiales bacterium]|nr:hypothetical protein [Longimicrobiales bacterium]